MNDSLLTISLIELPRVVGSTLERKLHWQAPSGLGNAVMQVPAGYDIDCDLTLTSIDEGVVATVDTVVEMRAECSRCLDPIVRKKHVHVSDLYVEDYVPPAAEDQEITDLNEDEVRPISSRNTINLESLLRDAIIPLAEERPLCRKNCQGLCADCGERLEDLPLDHHHDQIDPRMAILEQLLKGHSGDMHTSDKRSGKEEKNG